MLRFPNPGSTIDNIVRVYGAAFDRLNGQVVDLDANTRAVVGANLATSSGYMGDEAIARSTRKDRSRDQLYNQLKMYAELFRSLGWMHSTERRALEFTFTLLGEQLVATGHDFWPLLEECMLGVVYPTPHLSIRGTYDLRPFAFILRVMGASGGHLSRTELIVGPLTQASDRGTQDLNSVVARVAAVRQSAAAADKAINKVAAARSIQVNTLGNYTRWPIALMRDAGWMRKGQAKYRDGRFYETWMLTEKGQRQADRVNQSFDLRAGDLAKFDADKRAALAVMSHYRMLERAGFDVSTVTARIAAAETIAAPLLQQLGAGGKPLLFSPFQALPLRDIAKAFPDRLATPQVDGAVVATSGAGDGRNDRSHLFVAPVFVKAMAVPAQAHAVRSELSALLKKSGSPERAAAAFAAAHAKDKQQTFYPLVTHLFQLLGFRSEHSRAGVNYQRWDAAVWIGADALPVEIKSPTEELVLSTKAIRQAIENKVVLLARGGLETRRELTSLVVGNKLPNERGDMSNLIDDVFKAFGFRIGVIDLTTLAHLAALSVGEGKAIDPTQLSELRGFLNV